MERTLAAPMIHLSYARHGQNFFGRAEVPTRSGKVRFAVMVPLADVKEEVKRFLAAQPPEISGDVRIAGNMSQIVERIARKRARRRLGTAVKAKFGGDIRPYEIAGPAGYAYRVAKTAAAKKRGWHHDVPTEIGWSLGGMLKSAAKGVGSGIKAVGKGTVAVAKGVGKGTVAVAKGVGKGTEATGKAIGKGSVAAGKGVYKVGNVVTKNPITRALVSVVPGGAAALAIADAARGGSPGAQEAINQTNAIAQQTGDPTATRSASILNQAVAGQSNKGSNTAMIAVVGLGTLGGLYLLSGKRR
jgi:hypothetical protein